MSFKKPKNRTKALISLALYQLILRHNHYDNITVKDICETAGVSRMSFYRYYNKKEDILIDYCDERFAEFYEEFFQNSEPNGRTFLIGMFNHFKKYHRQLSILLAANKQSLLMNQFDSYTRYLFGTWRAIRESSLGNNPVVAPFVSGGVFNLLMYWLSSGMKETPEEMTNAVFALFPEVTK